VDQPREECSLREVELGHGLVEVRLRRRLDAVPPAAEVDRVQVHLQELLLRVLAFELPRHASFCELPRERLHRLTVSLALLEVGEAPEVEVLRELLGDRRAALGRSGLRPQVARRGSDDRSQVESLVPPEALVLDGDHRVADVLGDLRQFGDVPVDLAVQVRDDIAICVVDLRRRDGQPVERLFG
jgi:hypothetical protein